MLRVVMCNTRNESRIGMCVAETDACIIYCIVVYVQSNVRALAALSVQGSQIGVESRTGLHYIQFRFAILRWSAATAFTTSNLCCHGASKHQP